MQCNYFQNKDAKRCNAFPNVFEPDHHIVEEYCNGDRYKSCPFYMKTTFHKDIARISNFIRKISITS